MFKRKDSAKRRGLDRSVAVLTFCIVASPPFDLIRLKHIMQFLLIEGECVPSMFLFFSHDKYVFVSYEVL